MIEKIADRISTMGNSIFATMSKLSAEYNATNLGQGFPDFDGPSELIEEAYLAMKASKNQYAPSQGIFSLRKNIAEIQNKYYGMDFDPETEITITTGATEALYCSINAFVNPGDEVILFEPYYDAYYSDVILAGGIPRFVTLKKPNFSFDENELRDLINNETKIIVLNTPHNPTGKVFRKDELEIIAKIAIENNLLIISDEAYEFLTFNQIKHIPIATLPGMRNRTITINSTGKTFGMTGWKIGYASASPNLTTAIRKVHQWTTFAVNTPIQNALAYGFANLEKYIPEFVSNYQNKRDLALNLLKKTKFKAHKPDGSYFIMIDIPDNIFVDDVDAATKLVREYGVATIPPSVFYSKSDEGKTMLRLCFAKSDDTLKKGIEKLALI